MNMVIGLTIGFVLAGLGGIGMLCLAIWQAYKIRIAQAQEVTDHQTIKMQAQRIRFLEPSLDDAQDQIASLRIEICEYERSIGRLHAERDAARQQLGDIMVKAEGVLTALEKHQFKHKTRGWLHQCREFKKLKEIAESREGFTDQTDAIGD